MTTAILDTPKWLLIVRAFQIVISIIVLGISSYGVYWVVFNSYAFTIFLSVVTIIIVLYGVLTSKIPKWSVAYNYWAVLALDIFGVIFWLSAMGALAALRASFIYEVFVNGCGHSGGIGGGYCYKKREITKRAVAGDGYLAAMSAAAGMSAINFVLFVVTLVFTGLALHRARKEAATSVPPTTDDSKLEASYGMEAVQTPPPPPASDYNPQQPTQYQQPPPPANY